MCWLTLLLVSRSAALLSRVVLLAKLGLSAVSAGWAHFLCEILTYDFVPEGHFSLWFSLPVCLS